MNTLHHLGIGLVAAALGAAPASAREEGASASSLGVADAVRSSAVGPTALYFNPAGLHQFLQYTVETGYQFNNPMDGHVFTAAIADSATNQSLAMGLAYSYVMGHELTTDVKRKGHMLRFAAASGYRTDDWSFHLGAGGRWIKLDLGDDGAVSELTMDVGGIVVLKDMFRFAVVGHNLIETGLSEAPRSLGLGVSVLYGAFIASFDTVLDFETLDHTEAQYDGGLEYAIGGRLPLRVGYQYDRVTDRQYISAGLGYLSQTLALDFGFRQNLEQGDDNLFSVNARVFVP